MNCKLILAAVAVGALASAAPAFAAPTINWGGFYAGVNLGYGGGSFKYHAAGTFTPTGASSSPTSFDGGAKQTSSGVLGGAQVGYNYQSPAGWVAGLEADIDGSGIKGDTRIGGNLSGLTNGGANLDANSQIDYFGTVRARVGAPIFEGRFLPYVTGGLAYGQVESNASIGGLGLGGGAVSTKDTHVGWTAGAGADYALTDHLSFRAEYLYLDLGRQTLANGGFDTGVGALAGSIDRGATANVARVGLNWRFGG